MESEFKIYNKINSLYSYVNKYIANNIPNVHRHIRINLQSEIYGLIRIMYQASYTKGNIRMKNITDMLVTISMIDMLFHLLVEICPTCKKYLVKAISFLTEIKNMVYAWKVNEEKN